MHEHAKTCDRNSHALGWTLVRAYTYALMAQVLLVRQRFYARQFFAFQELQRGSTAG